MLFATVPAAPPTRKNQRTTSCPAPISANVPYQRGSRLILSALEWVSGGSSFTEVGTTKLPRGGNARVNSVTLASAVPAVDAHGYRIAAETAATTADETRQAFR